MNYQAFTSRPSRTRTPTNTKNVKYLDVLLMPFHVYLWQKVCQNQTFWFVSVIRANVLGLCCWSLQYDANPTYSCAHFNRCSFLGKFEWQQKHLIQKFTSKSSFFCCCFISIWSTPISHQICAQCSCEQQKIFHLKGALFWCGFYYGIYSIQFNSNHELNNDWMLWVRVILHQLMLFVAHIKRPEIVKWLQTNSSWSTWKLFNLNGIS